METINPGNKPEKKFSAGPVSATIFKNQGKSKNGEIVEYKTISIQRVYKDKNDNWQYTNSLRVNDLPKATLVLNKAYEYLNLKDSDQDSGSDIDVEEII